MFVIQHSKQNLHNIFDLETALFPVLFEMKTKGVRVDLEKATTIKNDLQKQENNKIIQGEFSLKNLGYFIKCTNLCNQIEMYLENNLPLVVKYNVASLGEIKLCLAPLPAS